MQLDPRALSMDPVLASSFFSAIDMFSGEVFEKSTPVIQIDYGYRVFTVIHGVQTNLVAICTQRLNQDVLDIMDSLLAEFELEWLAVAQSFEVEETFVDIYLEAFGEVVLKRLTFQELPDSWVPYLTIKPDAAPMTSSVILSFINGSRTVKEIRDVSGVSKEKMLLEISRLWAHRVIRFRNMLNFKDFLTARSQFLRYIQSTSSEIKDLGDVHPEMVGIIPRFAGLIDGRRTVQEILTELKGLYDERELLRVMDYLNETEVIEVLSPEKRRILLAKEVFELALRTAETLYGVEESTKALLLVMNSSETPETLGQLHLKDEAWAVDFDFKILEGFTPKRLMLLYGEWIKMLAQYVDTLDRTSINDFIVMLTKTFIERIINRYSSFDLRGIEEFSFWLELLSNDSLPEVGIVETGPYDQLDLTSIEEIVSILITRAQVIYGSEPIERICSASGVELVSKSSSGNVQTPSIEKTTRFLKEYSKLGPGAKLTLLILSRQRGISLPKEIEF